MTVPFVEGWRRCWLDAAVSGPGSGHVVLHSWTSRRWSATLMTPLLMWVKTVSEAALTCVTSWLCCGSLKELYVIKARWSAAGTAAYASCHRSYPEFALRYFGILMEEKNSQLLLNANISSINANASRRNLHSLYIAVPFVPSAVVVTFFFFVEVLVLLYLC